MQYKTIVLALLEQQPEILEQLRSQQALLPTLERYSTDLKASHEAWKLQLSHAKPDSDTIQIASEALEVALQELKNRLSLEAHQQEDESPSLEGAMAFLKRHTPPA